MEPELVEVGDLSFVGLLRRLEVIDRLKADVRHPSEEQVATMETEARVKKIVQEQLVALSSSSMTKEEKNSAKKFLDAQLKSVAKDMPGADKRRTKFNELIGTVLAADSAQEPAHVVKARAEVPRAEKGYAEIHKAYEKWEKGKQMLSVDELKVLKRTHEEGEARLEAAKLFIEVQIERRIEAAAPLPSVLAAKSTASAVGAAGKAKAAAKSSPSVSNVRGGGPATRMTGTIPFSTGPGGRPPGAPASGYPSTAAFLQAEAAAAMRVEATAEKAREAPAAPPRPRPQPKQQDEDAPVLSFACTVTAVAEHLGVKEDDARQMAGSSTEFTQHFDRKTWETIKERSLAIEREKREQAREKEKHKAAAALARATNKLPMQPGVGQAAAKSSGAAAKASGAGASRAAPDAKSKAKAKPQGAPKKNGNLATGNAFAGFGSDDSDEEQDPGWTKAVRR